MKLFCLAVLYKGAEGNVLPLTASHELSSFGYFQKGSVKEFMVFTCKIITERTGIAQRASVKEQEYMCHVYCRHDSLAGVVIADHEYPQRVAHTLISKMLDDFAGKYGPTTWPQAAPDSLHFPDLETFLQKYQNPKEADAMSRLQSDLDDTKIILHNTIEAVLTRGEKLDDLVDKSEGLSMQSKAFYKTAKKTNSCCAIL